MVTKKNIQYLLSVALLLSCGSALAQVKLGFVEQERIKVDSITTDAQIAALPVTQKQTTRGYYDGLGRSIQTVAVQASPLLNDIIQPAVYDNLGRQTVGYLPYAGQSTDTMGSYRSNAISTAQPAFYNQTSQYLIPVDTAARSRQLFENSPLQRLLETGMVGNGYQPNVSGARFKTVSYRSNVSGDGNILIWNHDGSFTMGNFYAANSLSVKDGKDEAGSETLVFTDIAGHTILKRQLLGGANVDTYYIYNNAGMVSFIIPPGALSLMVTDGSYSISQSGVSALIFQFTYDGMGRLITKTVPAKGTMSIVYDPMSRPVLMQDANLNSLNEWNYIRYDAKGRVISQGIYTDATSTRLGRANMQAYVNSLSASYNTSWYESRSTTVATGYYTANVFPTMATGTLTPLAYAYYDNYDLTDAGSDKFAYVSQGLTQGSIVEETQTTAALRGIPTMIRSTTVGAGVAAGTWLLKVMFYDKRGNVIQVRSNNHVYNTTDILTDFKTTVPDFMGVPQITQVSKQTAASTTVTVQTSFSYDQMYRLLSVSQRYNAGTSQVVAVYSYNELGQVVKKNLGQIVSGSLPANISTGTYGATTLTATNSITFTNGFTVPPGSTLNAFISNGYLQTLDYRYNIRGQLLSINNSQLANDGGITNADNNDVFGMQFIYDQPDASIGNNPSYDGSISAVKWMSKDGSGNATAERSYKFNYDLLKRYTSENYGERVTPGSGSFSNNASGFDEAITYNSDNSGNILSLTRNSSTQGTNSHTQIDNLSYAYDPANPNQLHTVNDATNNAGGFYVAPGNTAGGSYIYDVNGNLKTDPNKGLSIGYNYLNRTDKITVTTGSGQWIDYTYDASGNLIRKRQYNNSAILNTTDYVDGFVYVNSTLSYFPMPEGRVINAAGTLVQEFVIKDQQGNARVSFTNSTTNPGTAVVTQENSYYGSGLILPNSPVGTPGQPVNKQLYNGGSEWQSDYTNLPDYYQTFNRNYDAAIARFVGVDPVAESAESMTSYQYAGNNPVMNNDPNGDLLDPSRLPKPTPIAIGPSGFGHRSGGDDWDDGGWDDDDGGDGGVGDGSGGSGLGGPAGLQYYLDVMTATGSDVVGHWNSSSSSQSFGDFASTYQLAFAGSTGNQYMHDPLTGNTEVTPNGLAIDTYGTVNHDFETLHTGLDGDGLPAEDGIGYAWSIDNISYSYSSINQWSDASQGGMTGQDFMTSIANGPIGKPIELSFPDIGVSGEVKEAYTVYKGVTESGGIYWGLTKDLVRRAAEHGERFTSITEQFIDIGSKGAARGLEQLMIDASDGIENLENSINSIGINNPKLMEYYQEAIRYLSK